MWGRCQHFIGETLTVCVISTSLYPYSRFCDILGKREWEGSIRKSGRYAESNRSDARKSWQVIGEKYGVAACRLYVLLMLFGKKTTAWQIAIYHVHVHVHTNVMPRTRFGATLCIYVEMKFRKAISTFQKRILWDPATRSAGQWGSGVKKATFTYLIYVSMTSLHTASD